MNDSPTCNWTRSTRVPKRCTKPAKAHLQTSNADFSGNFCYDHIGRIVANAAKFGDSMFSNSNGDSIRPL